MINYILLFGVGCAAGFINVNAGGGSSLTLPALIFMGLDAACANGTNRIALLTQNISAIWSFRQEKFAEFKTSLKYALFTIPGAVLGAVTAVHIDDELFKKILGIVMIGIIITLIIPKSREKGRRVPEWFIYPALIIIGFYGGFIQMGVGFLFMAALTMIVGLDLIRTNMHKVFIVLIYMIPSIAIFAWTGNVHLIYGLTLGVGNAVGAWWGAKLAVKKGEKIVRMVLVVAMVFMAFKLLGIY
ncbi:sulfite exporter TauE/SafE family protein [candidate division KSB1 bacterium]|nr:sulfite exporter TauE/SafE family protein [candidate division KSB1 bacterium]